MRLDAVTVCVHESDSLALTLANREQFDRWLIVTVPGDRATIQFCRDHGLACHLSTVLDREGLDVLAGSNRARAMAEGVEALDRGGWVAMISSYLLLPRLFRAQLDALPLATDCRYRLGGVRLCANRRMFERLKCSEPWRSDPPKEGDDAWFQLVDARASATARVASMPMTALLLGDGALQWGAGILESERVPGQNRRGIALRDLLGSLFDRPRLLVAGHYPGLDPRAWAPLCAQVFLADDFGLARRTGDALAAAAAERLRDLWRAEAAGFDTLVDLDAAGGAIADRSLDAIYIPGEVSVERLAAGLPLWRRKLKENALICGDLYGRPHWAEASLAIAQLIGPPDVVAPTGFWHKRIDPDSLPAIPDAARTPCVVLVNPPGGDPERVLASLHALRLQWPGRLIVADQRASAELRVACLCYGAEFQRDATAPTPSLTLMAGTLAVRPLAPLFASRWARLIGRARAAMKRAVRKPLGRKERPPVARLAAATGGAWSVPVAKASALADGSADERALIRYRDDPETWSPDAHRLWSKMITELRAKLTPSIPVAPDSTIVVIVGHGSSQDFQDHRGCWNFAADVPVLTVCAGAVPDEPRLRQGSTDVLALTGEAAADPRQLMRALLGRVRTGRIILLPPSARPLPGATLFTAPAWSALPIAFHSTAEVRRTNGAVPLPWKTEPLLLSAAVDHLDRLCEIDLQLEPNDDVRSWVRKAVALHGGGWEICNVESWGWRVQ
jgi:hypothetical protein